MKERQIVPDKIRSTKIFTQEMGNQQPQRPTLEGKPAKILGPGKLQINDLKPDVSHYAGSEPLDAAAVWKRVGGKLLAASEIPCAAPWRTGRLQFTFVWSACCIFLPAVV
jgi:hypothetical protein